MYVNGMPAIVLFVCGIGEGAPLDFDIPHLPKNDMVSETAAVGGEQVVVVHFKRAVVEMADITCRRAVWEGVRIGVHFHSASVVDEIGAVGLDDAASGGKGDGVLAQACTDAAEGVFNNSPVL